MPYGALTSQASGKQLPSRLPVPACASFATKPCLGATVSGDNKIIPKHDQLDETTIVPPAKVLHSIWSAVGGTTQCVV